MHWWQSVQDVLGGLGLGAIAGQLADLQLGELLDTPPPGLDEAVAIAKVCLCAKFSYSTVSACSWQQDMMNVSTVAKDS